MWSWSSHGHDWQNCAMMGKDVIALRELDCGCLLCIISTSSFLTHTLLYFFFVSHLFVGTQVLLISF